MRHSYWLNAVPLMVLFSILASFVLQPSPANNRGSQNLSCTNSHLCFSLSQNATVLWKQQSRLALFKDVSERVASALKHTGNIQQFKARLKSKIHYYFEKQHFLNHTLQPRFLVLTETCQRLFVIYNLSAISVIETHLEGTSEKSDWKERVTYNKSPVWRT